MPPIRQEALFLEALFSEALFLEAPFSESTPCTSQSTTSESMLLKSTLSQSSLLESTSQSPLTLINTLPNQRLDLAITPLLGSRTKAQDAIHAGRVFCNGIAIAKSSYLLKVGDELKVLSEGLLLGRAGYKLRYFLQSLLEAGLWQPRHLEGKRALDVGASTGGFTQVLLEGGAESVCCIDVGRSQLHEVLRSDRRVRFYEECDVRDFADSESFSESRAFDVLVCDVSFISLYKLIDALISLNAKEYILLFKPQFEVGKEAKRDKKGVLKDPSLGERAMNEFCDYLAGRGFEIRHRCQSGVSGKEGNIEFFIYACK